MKIVIKIFFVFLLFFSFFAACKKSDNTGQNTNSKSVLTLSKTTVKRGEQLLASTNLSETGSKIKWTVYPSGSSNISSANKEAAAIFALAGTYHITASYYSPSDTSVAYDSSSSPITVTDSFYTPTSNGMNVDTASLAGDQITLIPVMASDSVVVMLAQTRNLYNCTPYLTAYGAGGNFYSNYSLLFDFKSGEVVEGTGDCNGAKNPAIAYIFFNPAANGTYNFSAFLNGVTYQGSVTVTNTDYTFSWNYTSGIIISPLQIKKQ
jgi:hypothetical protein